MKVNINILKGSLFKRVHYLDLDTGLTRAKFHIDKGWASMPEHSLLLPVYNRAYLYQKYLREMLPKTGIPDEKYLLDYKDFPRILSDGFLPTYTRDYISKADHFITGPEWSRYEFQHEKNKASGSSEYDPTFVTYYEYSEAYKRKIAIEWCETQGYEWYEE